MPKNIENHRKRTVNKSLAWDIYKARLHVYKLAAGLSFQDFDGLLEHRIPAGLDIPNRKSNLDIGEDADPDQVPFVRESVSRRYDATSTATGKREEKRRAAAPSRRTPDDPTPLHDLKTEAEVLRHRSRRFIGQ